MIIDSEQGLTSLASRAGLLCLVLGMAACEGPQGPMGISGADGIDGVNGRDGRDGDDGATGPAGERGPAGEDGDPGPAGEDGLEGAQGQSGLNGRDGRDGQNFSGGSSGGSLNPGEAGVVSLSVTGHDRLFGVTFAPDGNILATGQVSTDIDANADFSVLLAKFLPDGSLDRRFGNDGVVTRNVSPGGTSRELARGIVVQSTGNIVIAGAAEHDPGAEGVFANDTDVVLLRFLPDGTPDADFGEDGIVRVNLNDGVEGTNANGPTLLGADSPWTVALGPDDSLVVHSTQRAEGFQTDGVTERTDSDWALVKLTADGELDTSFSEDGIVTLDIAEANASARSVTVLPDGSIIGSGYTTSTALGVSTQQPVLYKVTPDGEFDDTFATADAIALPGVWHDFATDPLATGLRSEAYGAALQGDSLVTMGYGPTPTVGGTGTDWVSFRFTASGEQDLTYGTDGRTYIDAGGFGDNGRFVMTLPDDRILGVGVGRRAASEQPERDAMVAILTADGLPDTNFAPGGFKLFDTGGDADHFWSAAISEQDPTQVAIVGIAGGRVGGVNDDDSVLLLLPIE